MKKLPDRFCVHKGEFRIIKATEAKLKKYSKKEWTPEDTRRLYPLLTEEEAKMAWEEGW